MRMFLAGGITGNLNPFWRCLSQKLKTGQEFKIAGEEAMRIFLAGGESRHWIHDTLLNKSQEDMQIYIAGTWPYRNLGDYDPTVFKYKPFILESFYYVDEDTERLLPYFGDFLLDSGAFTFMQGNHNGKIQWEEYVDSYSDFILRNKVEKFFELDIDSVVGYESVLKLRKRLEKKTGRECIPVWHKSRGIEEFKKDADRYSYIAIGGIVSKEITKDQYKAFPSMIKEAHKRKCKIHGLGFTSLEWLSKCHFDSVDSTAWTTGNRFGYIYKFNGETMEKIDVPDGQRISKPRETALINFTEWIKFQKYAEVHL